MDNSLYSPGLHKLIKNLDHLKKIQDGSITSPLHISIWPTKKCQFRCAYCCFKNMEDDGKILSLSDFINLTDILCKYGLKAMEFAGGGEPTLWPYFDQGVEYAYNKGLSLSLVTNGLVLNSSVLDKFKWIRVSFQNPAHSNIVDLSNIPSTTRVSGSLIVHDDKSFNFLEYFHSYASKNNIVIRVAPNKPCSLEFETKVKNAVDSLGYPLLFFTKERGTPKACYMSWLRAAIDWRGFLLPCPSIELAEEFEGAVPDSHILCHISELEEWLINNPPRDLGFRCSYCNCGKTQNDFIYDLLQDIEDAEFI